ncbi:MAG: hypothetical protein ACK5JD_12330 [Mangrovibacterium sp.]
MDSLNESLEMSPAPYALGHNLVFAGLDFAESYGFKPHKNFALTQYILDEDTDEVELMEIPCGDDDGKPFYMQGPNDSDARAAQIIAQLEKQAGPGNYNFAMEADEYLDEYSDWEQEYSNLPMHEKLDRFEKSLANMKSMNETEQAEFAFLTSSILRGYVDINKSNRLTASLRSKMEKYEISDELSAPFLGLETIVKSLEQLQEKAITIYQLIGQSRKKAQKEWQKLQKANPEIPLLYFLELLLLHTNESEEYAVKVREYHQRFPDYPLLKIEWTSYTALIKEQNRADELFASGPQAFFGKRKKIHPIEQGHFLMLMILASMVEENITYITAVQNLIDEIDLEEVQYQAISELYTVATINFILSLRKKNES